MKTIQPSQFSNRIFLKERLTTGLKIQDTKTQNKYIIEGIDLEESDLEKQIYCYILNMEVWSIPELYIGREYEVSGYKPEYTVELKPTKTVEEYQVDEYFENIRDNKRLEREYREFKNTKGFNLSGLWAKDREKFKV